MMYKRNLMMRELKLFLVLSMLLVFVNACLKDDKHALNPRQKTNFGKDWQFQRTINSTGEYSPLEDVVLPHAVSIEPLIIQKQWQGEAIYRKDFDFVDQKNRKAFLYFEGVMQEARVFLNGKELAHHVGGYLPFTVDITDFVQAENNLLEVKTNNFDNLQIPPGKTLETLDFNFYGGIYRNVYLITTNKLFIPAAVNNEKQHGGGVLLHFDDISSKEATGILKVHVQNDFEAEKSMYAEAAFSQGDKLIQKVVFDKTQIKAGEGLELSQNFKVLKPQLWMPETPHLYNVEIKLFGDDELMDVLDVKAGIRKIELSEEGFFLNGQKRYIRGTNRHQEYPFVGYALSDEAQYRDAVKIKNAGFDFVRLSHYPHAEAFMDACDELGLMTMNCIPGWQYSGDSVFIENSYQDCRDLIRRDRNHPSVIFWELSLNESEMTETYIQKVNAILDDELPFDDIFSAGWMDYPAYDLFIPARQHGQPPDYWNFYKQGKRPVFIAEYGDWEYYAQNAGFNQTAFGDLKSEERTSRQLREYGEKRLLQQSLNFQEAANSNRKGSGTIGDANWLMFDYNRGYSPDLESSGISSIFRIPKFARYFYQSQQPPKVLSIPTVESGPMLKIANYWTENSPLQVKVYSNCREVELFLNGRSVKRIKPTHDQYSPHLQFPPFIFDLEVFESGTLRAVGFIDGEALAEDVVTTPKDPFAIKLETDLSGIPINPEFSDVIFVYAKIVDENGTLIPDADHAVQFSILGNAEIIGDNPATAKAGIATILLQTNGLIENLKIEASAKDLKKGEIDLK